MKKYDIIQVEGDYIFGLTYKPIINNYVRQYLCKGDIFNAAILANQMGALLIDKGPFK